MNFMIVHQFNLHPIERATTHASYMAAYCQTDRPTERSAGFRNVSFLLCSVIILVSSVRLATGASRLSPHGASAQAQTETHKNGGNKGRELCLYRLSLIHISEPTRLLSISYAVFCLNKKKQQPTTNQRKHATTQ